MTAMSGHRCTPGLLRIDRSCTWHYEHVWCPWCHGYYGVSHEHGGCHSQPESDWTCGVPSTACACRFCTVARTDGWAAATTWAKARRRAVNAASTAPKRRWTPGGRPAVAISSELEQAARAFIAATDKYREAHAGREMARQRFESLLPPDADRHIPGYRPGDIIQWVRTNPGGSNDV